MPESAYVWGAVALGAGLGGFVQGLTGFAFGMVAMSIWAWALPPQVAAPLVVFGALLGQVASLFSFRRGFEASIILTLIVGGAFGVPIGVFLLHNANPGVFKLAMGVLLTGYSLISLGAGVMPRIRAGGRAADAGAGFVGGVLGGLGGLAGTVPATWGLLRGWKADVRRATMQAYNIPMHCLTLALYWRTGALATTPGLFLRCRRRGPVHSRIFWRKAVCPRQRGDLHADRVAAVAGFRARPADRRERALASAALMRTKRHRS